MRTPFLILLIAMVGIACGDRVPASVKPDALDPQKTLRSSRSNVPVSLGATPLFSLGTITGPEEEQFWDIRGVVVRSDGAIVVAEATTQDIRFFSSSGEFLFAVGGPGQGPEEFHGLAGLFLLPGDTLIAQDYGSLYLSLIDPFGDFVGRVRPDLSPRQLIQLKGLLVGRRLVVAQEDVVPTGDGIWGEGRFPTFIFDSSGAPVADLEELSSQRYFSATYGGTHVNMPVAFSPEPHVAVSGDRVALGNGSSYRITVYDGAGSQVGIIDRPPRGRLISKDDSEEFFREARNDDYAVWDRYYREMAQEIEIPKYFPEFSGLYLDPHGLVWVEMPRTTSDGGKTTWEVYNSGGEFLSEIQTEIPFKKVHFIGSDKMILGQISPWGAPLLVVLEIERAFNSEATPPHWDTEGPESES